MNTITLWLLVAMNSTFNASASGHIVVVERFATSQACEDVRRRLPRVVEPSMVAVTTCIPATVVRP
jgi:hypothetical protein